MSSHTSPGFAFGIFRLHRVEHLKRLVRLPPLVENFRILVEFDQPIEDRPPLHSR
jgi:hypothetical protein